MIRKKRRLEEPEHSDRWVISYADFITLLFAFFTTLYAISRVDLGKLQLFEGSMKSAFKATTTRPVETGVIDGIKPANYADIALERDIRAQFKKFAIIESVAIQRDDRGVVMSFGDMLLFESGDADLRIEARPVLSAVAGLIKQSQRAIIIEGHTDNLPLKSPRFSSNIELSAARAARVFSFLLDEEALQPERMTVAGYGEYRPVASNATPEGRVRNRRVDIIFVSKKDGA